MKNILEDLHTHCERNIIQALGDLVTNQQLAHSESKLVLSWSTTFYAMWCTLRKVLSAHSKSSSTKTTMLFTSSEYWILVSMGINMGKAPGKHRWYTSMGWKTQRICVKTINILTRSSYDLSMNCGYGHRGNHGSQKSMLAQYLWQMLNQIQFST